MKIVIAASTRDFINAFLIEFIISLSKYHKVLIVTDKNITKFKFNKNITQKNLKFHRKISILNDIKCFFQFYSLIINFSPKAVISFTPKVGLISAITGYFCFVRIRLHYFTGQIWAMENKKIGKILKFSDKLISLFSTHILCDSYGQKEFLTANNIVKKNKINVIHKGSIKGVDLDTFQFNYKLRKKIRQKLSLSNKDKIILIVSRLNKDKGIQNLPYIINPIFKKFKNLFVLIIGKDEENLKQFLLENFYKKNRVKFIKHTNKLNQYLVASDLLLITSYREGFGNVALEASACELPIISNNIYGLKDIVKNNYNGLKYKNNDYAIKYLMKILNNKKLRERYGKNGRKMATLNYDTKNVVKKLTKYIDDLINA